MSFRGKVLASCIMLAHLFSILLGARSYAENSTCFFRLFAGTWITGSLLGTLSLCILPPVWLGVNRSRQETWQRACISYAFLLSLGLSIFPCFWFVRSWTLFGLAQGCFLLGMGLGVVLGVSSREESQNPGCEESLPKNGLRSGSIERIAWALLSGYLFLSLFFKAWDSYAILTGGFPILGAITGMIAGVLAGVLFLKTAALMVLVHLLFGESRPRLRRGLLILGGVCLLCFASPYLLAPKGVLEAQDQLVRTFGQNARSVLSRPEPGMMSSPLSGVSFYYGLGPYRNWERKRHILFKQTDQAKLHFDVYYPKEPSVGRNAGILFIHGGGWHLGDTGMVWQNLAYLASQGYVVFDIQYRLMDPSLVDVKRELGLSVRPRVFKGPDYLCGPYRIPDMVQDIGDFTHYLADPTTETFGADLSRMFIMGQSAGAHLAGVVGFGYDHPYFRGVFSESLQLIGMVLYYPPNDMARMIYHDHPMFATFGLIKGCPASNPEEFFHYTPSHLIEPGEPATLILQGTVDTMVPLYNARAIEAELRTVGAATVWMNGYFGGHAHDMTPSHGVPGLYILERFLYLVREQEEKA